MLLKHSSHRRALLKGAAVSFCNALTRGSRTPAKGAQQRYVIMHVVPWLPPGSPPPAATQGLSYSTLAYQTQVVRNYEAHLAKMQQIGVDVVALDVQARPGWQPSNPQNAVIWQQGHPDLWMETMQKMAPEMHFTFCLDRLSNEVTPAERWPLVINTLLAAYGNNPRLFRLEGKPLLQSFALNEFVTAQQWMAIRKQIQKPCLLIGDVMESPFRKVGPKRERIDEEAIQAMIDACDGLSASPLGCLLPWVSTNFPRLAAMTHARHKPYIWGVAPGYYRKGVAFIEPTFAYLHKTWTLAIESPDRCATIYTWNDIDEDTDCWPSIHKGEALLELHRFYIQWFHTGRQPRPARDLVFINYPTTNSGRRVPAGGENPTWPRLGYWVLLQQPATLSLTGLGEARLPAGLSIGHLGPVTPGSPTRFQLHRSGRLILSGMVKEPMIDQREDENLTYRWLALHRRS